MHYFTEQISDNELLINNLKLLNYNISDANTIFRLNLQELTIENINKHSKLIIHIIHFLISKCVDDDHFINYFKQFYPPRTQLEQSIYKQEIAKYLQKYNKPTIPKNYIITKTTLDTKIIQSLKFLSEFALRNSFMLNFPKKQLKTFYSDPMKIFLDDRPCVNEASDIYIIASYQFENNTKDNIKIPPQVLKIMTAHCGYSILQEVDKLKQILLQNNDMTKSIECTVQLIRDCYKNERERGLVLIQQLQSFKNSINQSYLSQERKLDRQPLLDDSFKTFKGIQNIIDQFYQLKIDHNINQIQSTSRLDKFSEEESLNQIQDNYNTQIDQKLNEILRLEQQTWVMERAQRTRQASRDTLLKLEGLLNSL